MNNLFFLGLEAQRTERVHDGRFKLSPIHSVNKHLIGVEDDMNAKTEKIWKQRIWVKIPKKNGTWKGVNKGDELIGTYLKKITRFI